MKCPECQLEISEDSNFCKGCGHHLSEIPKVEETQALMVSQECSAFRAATGKNYTFNPCGRDPI
jgi:hypothetical protein